jgi:hypothetical protein
MTCSPTVVIDEIELPLTEADAHGPQWRRVKAGDHVSMLCPCGTIARASETGSSTWPAPTSTAPADRPRSTKRFTTVTTTTQSRQQNPSRQLSTRPRTG